MDNNVLICRCEEVTLIEIERAIEDGAISIDGVKKRTRAGMGYCQGKTCSRLVENIIAEKTKRDITEILFPTVRAPVRPVNIGIVAQDFNEK
jgi:NAD(P)H-nitrite reductase large subunit